MHSVWLWRRWRALPRQVLPIAAALGLVPLVLGCGAPAAKNVTVTTQAFTFEPAALEWRTGQPVRLQLRNPDAVEHDFVVDGLKFSTAASGAGHDSHSSSASAAPTPPPGGLHVHTDAFSERTITFTPLSKGSYTIYCTIPGHKEAGMTARLVVS